MRENKKTIISKMLAPLLGAGILVLAVVALVNADTSDNLDITIIVAASAPLVGSPTDNGSSAATPTNVGSNVTFSTTATDPGGAGYWLAICKTGGTITPSGTGGAPTCTAGAWCISSSAVASDTQNSCTYTAQQADPMSNAWVAYACNNHASGSGCSTPSSGDSPFHVNHPPVIGTVTIGPSYGSSASIDPGNGAYIRVAVSDPDTEAPADTIDMFVCSNNTTSFDAGTGACTGGTVYCSVTGVASGSNADCNSSAVVPIPTAHGSQNLKIFLRDNSSTKLKDNGTNNTHSFNVTDVAPTISGFSIGQNPLIPQAGGSVNQTFSATLTDNNGYADITGASGAIYVSPATLTVSGACTTSSELNCYNATSCSLTGGSGANVTVNCGASGNLITTWFNITPSASWKAHVNAVTDLGTTSFATEGTFTVNALNAIDVAETTIAYSNLSPGQTSVAKTVTLRNAGNIITDVLISGTDMASGSNAIPRAQQRWSPSSSFTWGDNDYALVGTPSIGTATTGCSDRSIAVTADHTQYTSSQIFWKLRIPATQATGIYTGTTYFNATPNNCSGGV